MILDLDRIPPGLSVSMLKALCHLAEVGDCRSGEFAEVGGFTSAWATGLVDSAERRGLMVRERDPGDRRVVRVAITRAGRELVESMRPSETGMPS